MTNSTLYAGADPRTSPAAYNTTVVVGSSYSLQIKVSQEGILKQISYFTPSGANLPTIVGVFAGDDTTPLLSATPTWSSGSGARWITTTVPDLELFPGVTYFIMIGRTSGSMDQAYLYDGGIVKSHVWIPAVSADGKISTSDTFDDFVHGPSGSPQAYHSNAGLVYPDVAFGGYLLNWLVDVGIDFGGVSKRIIFDTDPGSSLSTETSKRNYSSGVSQAVLYPEKTPGVPWTGLISVTEKGETGSTAFYVDGQKVRDAFSPMTFEGTITAFTYPDEFEVYNGLSGGVSGQPKGSFGLSYITNRELHIVYNVMTSPSSDQYSSLGDNVSPVAFSWAFSTVPVDIPAGRPSSHIVVMLDTADPGAVSDLQDILYGDDTNDPALPDPETVYSLFESHATLIITDNGDGTWTAVGPSTVITMLSGTEFQINWPSALMINSTTYQIYSL